MSVTIESVVDAPCPATNNHRYVFSTYTAALGALDAALARDFAHAKKRLRKFVRLSKTGYKEPLPKGLIA